MTAIPQVDSSSVRYLPTTSAYDLWASVYDTDGNFLQALDTIEMRRLLRLLVSEINAPTPWKIVDLGCGTGRNTSLLLTLPDTEVVALDASEGMLDVARRRLADLRSGEGREVKFGTFDLINDEPPALALQADAIVSTLVLEHIPADVYFSQVAKILKPGGVLLLTNMHSEMGSISQAGFVDPKTGEKVRPTSYAHTVEEVRLAAEKHGLEAVGNVAERAVDASMVEQLGERSRKWIGVTCWFGGLWRKKI
jgi:SAM-dependent methyltransferase